MISSNRSGYAPVNGPELYYEMYGSGDPLVLLHGGLGSIDMMTPLVPMLATGRQVIAFDLQAHGRTLDVDRPLRFEGMADDLAAALDHLGFGKVDVMGYSLGGGVALQLAIRHSPKARYTTFAQGQASRRGLFPVSSIRLVSRGQGRHGSPWGSDS